MYNSLTLLSTTIKGRTPSICLVVIIRPQLRAYTIATNPTRPSTNQPNTGDQDPAGRDAICGETKNGN